VELGFYLPSSNTGATRVGVSQIARQAEDMGFGSLWVADHLVAPTRMESPYPFTPDGSYHNSPRTPYLEPLTALAFVAGLTERPRLVISVLVLPYRHPLSTAKIAATVDVLSGGRLVLGVGVGWMAEEFAVLGHTYFGRRGANTDEQLEILRLAWTGEPFSYAGHFYEFDEVVVAPTPEQAHLPIWIGGHTTAALKRAVASGDGVNVNAGSPQETAEMIARIADLTAASGRSVVPDVTLRAHVRVSPEPEAFRPGHLIGPIDYLIERLAEYAELDVTCFGLDCRVDGFDTMLDTLNALAPVLDAIQG